MRKFSKLISLALAVVTVFSVTACRDNPQSDDGGNGNASHTPEIPIAEGVHDMTYTEADGYLLQNGKTDYKVVVPAVLTTELGVARTELVTLFAEATGVTLEVIPDEGLTHDEDNKYISLGNTALYQTAGISDRVDASVLKRDGARIITKDKTIYFMGGTSDFGVLYGVYDFLDINFGFEVYFKDSYALSTGVRELRLHNYDVTDVPDIEFRTRTSGAQNESTDDYNDRMFSYRTRTRDSFYDFLLPINRNLDVHNSIPAYFPHAEYDNSEYGSYIYGGQQLCYTAHGNADAYEFMTSEAAKEIEQALTDYTPAAYPNIKAVLLGEEDNAQMCNCTSCQEVRKKYNNSDAAAIIIFMKDVAGKVDAWMAQEENAAYRREGFQYMFFAYWGTEHSPFVYNSATGTYEAADSAVLPEDSNVVPFIAVKSLDHGKPLTSDANALAFNDLAAWTTVFPGSWVWSYGGVYTNYFCFVDNYAFYSEFFPYVAQSDVRFSFVQQHNHQRGSDTGFFNLAAYINGKLQWDASQDVNELIDRYFEGVYRAAAPAMKEYFTLCRLWFADALRDEQVWSTVITGNAKYFKIGTINNLFAQLNKAYEAIEVYERDEVLYERIKKNIDSEWLFPAITALNSNFEGYYTTDELSAMKTKFKEVCARLGLVAASETEDLSGLLNSL